MADKVAQLSANGGQPEIEINVSHPNGFIRGIFTVFLFDKPDVQSTVVGTTGKKVTNPHGRFKIPVSGNDLTNIDDCWMRYQVFVGDNAGIQGKWFLTIKVFQDGEIVDGGNISYKADLDAFDFIGDKVGLNVS